MIALICIWQMTHFVHCKQTHPWHLWRKRPQGVRAATQEQRHRQCQGLPGQGHRKGICLLSVNIQKFIKDTNRMFIFLMFSLIFLYIGHCIVKQRHTNCMCYYVRTVGGKSVMVFEKETTVTIWKVSLLAAVGSVPRDKNMCENNKYPRHFL